MKFIRTDFFRILASLGVAATLMTSVTSSAWADSPGSSEAKQNWASHRQQWVKAKLAKMAARLEIKASQQGAWAAFANAVNEPMAMPKRPEHGADAATLAHFRADLAAVHAKKLAEIADATASLQATLTPEQRKTLDQIVRYAGHHRHHAMMHHGHHEDGDRQEGRDGR